MQTTEKINLNKSLILAAPILSALHILGHLIVVFPLAFLGWWAIKTNSLMIITMVALASIYLYTIGLLIVWALMIRFLPKPKLGILHDPKDIFLNMIHAGLSYFSKMSGSRQALSLLPFPGQIFYSIVSKGKIHPSVFISNPDCISDAHLVEIGANTILGQGSILSGHFQPNTNDTTLGKIKIGKNVLIGGNSAILPNVSIGDNSIVQAYSLVKSGTIIPANEIWGGCPAKKIRSIKNSEDKENILSNEIQNDLESLAKHAKDNKFQV